MKETLERVYHICEILNNKFDGNLIEQEKLEDFINSVREDWDTSYGQLKEGIQIIESELASIDSSKNSEYTQGILDIFWGFRHLKVLIKDADELLGGDLHLPVPDETVAVVAQPQLLQGQVGQLS